MSWLRLDDGFASHPKISALDDRQFRVWMRVLCYCARYESPKLDLSARRAIVGLDLRVIKTFVRLKLVDEKRGEYVVHDWDHYQPKDRTGAERQRRWRSKRNAEVTDDVTENVTEPALPRPVPSLEISKDSSEPQDVAPRKSRGPTEYELIQAREQRERSGWVDNLGQYTGCRYVRGTHELSAVYDPLGTEYPPQDWPYQRPTRPEVQAALRERASA